MLTAMGSAALAEIENKKLSRPLAADDLFTRLTSLVDADKRDGPPSRGRRFSHSSSETGSSRTRLLTGTHHSRWLDTQELTYQGLVTDGSRPICSVEHISHLIATSSVDSESVPPWLTDYPDSELGKAEAYNVLGLQFHRWWDFRKSQWDNRGLGDSEEASEAYVKAFRRLYGGELAGVLRSKKFYRRLEETHRAQWKMMPVERQLPDQPFSDYSAAVEHRLAPYRFARPIQLQKDPRHQTQWTDWLEYLSYELWCLEELRAAVRPLEEEHDKALDRLLEVARQNDETNLNKPLASHVDLTKELKGIRATLETTNKSIWDMVRETSRYTFAEKTVRLRKSRIDWIVKEAYVMETEMAEEDGQQDKKSRPNSNKKRRQDDENKETALENQSKRPRRSGGMEIGLDTTGSKPQLRQSTRLAEKEASAEKN